MTPAALASQRDLLQKRPWR